MKPITSRTGPSGSSFASSRARKHGLSDFGSKVAPLPVGTCAAQLVLTAGVFSLHSRATARRPFLESGTGWRTYADNRMCSCGSLVRSSVGRWICPRAAYCARWWCFTFHQCGRARVAVPRGASSRHAVTHFFALHVITLVLDVCTSAAARCRLRRGSRRGDG
jgi:hypothetical protein